MSSLRRLVSKLEYNYFRIYVHCEFFYLAEFFGYIFVFVDQIHSSFELCNVFSGGLSDIGEQLDVARIGPEHQAGSDSILTCYDFLQNG